ncbi:UPF0158 family protein [Micromonospora sp. NPDC047548]|uniref:UPF0158 family protein n=1 Tax=Micromonospora sp. NPDC047548 TaxID=3155624 RepID=UPI0033FF6EAC
MADFAERVSDEAAGRRLARAIQGKGAFRRFRDELHEEYPHLLPAWYAFRDVRAQCRAVEWLIDNLLVDDEAGERFVTEQPSRRPTSISSTCGSLRQGVPGCVRGPVRRRAAAGRAPPGRGSAGPAPNSGCRPGSATPAWTGWTRNPNPPHPHTRLLRRTSTSPWCAAWSPGSSRTGPSCRSGRCRRAAGTTGPSTSATR